MVRGGAVSVAAIASVAVAPEARGRGIAGALLTHLHERADANKASVTTLYPFRQGYYAKHGYAPVTPNRRLLFHPAAIPSAWASEASSSGVTIRSVRATPDSAEQAAKGDAPSRSSDRTAIVSAYARAARAVARLGHAPAGALGSVLRRRAPCLDRRDTRAAHLGVRRLVARAVRVARRDATHRPRARGRRRRDTKRRSSARSARSATRSPRSRSRSTHATRSTARSSTRTAPASGRPPWSTRSASCRGDRWSASSMSRAG